MLVVFIKTKHKCMWTAVVFFLGHRGCDQKKFGNQWAKLKECICFHPNLHLACLGPLFLWPFNFFYHVSLHISHIDILKYFEVACCVTACVFTHECNISMGPQKLLWLLCSLVWSTFRPVPPPAVTQTVINRSFCTSFIPKWPNEYRSLHFSGKRVT